MEKIILLISFVITSLVVDAQELRCNVTVNYNKIKEANSNTFSTMQTALTQFMNERRWTSDVFEQPERIDCNLVIQLDEQVATNEFKGSVIVQLRRPIYDTSYESTLLNIKDNDFHIKYSEFEPLVFNESSNTDNLTSIMAFYAYIILGIDYDSFAPNAGDDYFQRAMHIVNNAQNTSYEGWKSYESEVNRYWLAENLTNRAYSVFRQSIYDYHRKGLDEMAHSSTDGRAVVADVISNLAKLYRTRPSLYLFNIFFDAKTTELINIFSGSSGEELNRAVKSLSEMDPSNSAKYRELKSKQSF
ncbi:MAG: DUF4835 family protein [Mangrovibacterium sp.]